MNKKILPLAVMGALLGSSYAAYSLTESQLQQSWKTGQSWQEMKLMSQKDFIILRQITDDIQQSHTVSDRDLEWTLALLKESKEPLARTRILTAFLLLKSGSQSQKEQILHAIAPFLNVREVNPLESTPAVKIHGVMQRLIVIPADTPTGEIPR